MGWEYEILAPDKLDRGRWISEIGLVELERPSLEYAAFVFLNSKKYRLNEMYVSAEVAKAAVERTYAKYTGGTK